MTGPVSRELVTQVRLCSSGITSLQVLRGDALSRHLPALCNCVRAEIIVARNYAGYPGFYSCLTEVIALEFLRATKLQERHGTGSLASILCHFARWCDATGLQLSEALKLAATLYSEETEGQGQQLSAQ